MENLCISVVVRAGAIVQYHMRDMSDITNSRLPSNALHANHAVNARIDTASIIPCVSAVASLASAAYFAFVAYFSCLRCVLACVLFYVACVGCIKMYGTQGRALRWMETMLEE